MSFDKKIHKCKMYSYQNTTFLLFFYIPFQINFPLPHTKILTFFTRITYCNTLYKGNHIVRILLFFFLLSIMSTKLKHVSGCIGSTFLNFKNSTIYLSVPLLVDMWTVSSFGLLWIKFLCALLNKSFLDMFSFLLDKHQGMAG